MLARNVEWLIAWRFVQALGGCAAAESWDGFSGVENDAGEARDSGFDARTNDAGVSPVLDGSTVDASVADAKTIDFVQGSSFTSNGNPTTTSSVTFDKQAQIAGDLNVVIVGWYDSNANIVSGTGVADTSGNTYRLATGPTTEAAGPLVQSIYYASGIKAAAAGANKITITFDTATDPPDIRALEYSGLDPVSPFEAANGGAGVGLTATSGAVTTTHAPVLLVAGGTTESEVTVAGSMFTLRIITADSNLAAARIVTAPGMFSTDAPISASKGWILQLAAFH